MAARKMSALTCALRASALLALLGLTAACTNTSKLYYWGDYQAMLHQYYDEPSNTPPAVQARSLENIIDQAQRDAAPVAPGIYAHLGVAYADLGKQADAEAAFAREVELYPEAKHWVDGMIERGRAAQEQ